MAAAATKTKHVCVMDMCVVCLDSWLVDWSVGVEWTKTGVADFFYWTFPPPFVDMLPIEMLLLEPLLAELMLAPLPFEPFAFEPLLLGPLLPLPFVCKGGLMVHSSSSSSESCDVSLISLDIICEVV